MRPAAIVRVTVVAALWACTPPVPKPPAAPTELTATATGPTAVELSWASPAGTTFQVLRDGTRFAETGTQDSFTDTTVAANSSHTYAVIAVADGLASASSETVTVVTPPTKPAMTSAPIAVDEDVPFHLALQSTVGDDGPETETIIVSFLPAGFVASGPLAFPPTDLSTFTVTPPANVDGQFEFFATVMRTGRSGLTTTSDAVTVLLTLGGVADVPTLVTQDASGEEDSAIPLSIAAALADTDGSETLSIVLANVPMGAALSAGTNMGDGRWTLSPAQLSGLTITPAPNAVTPFAMQVTATATERRGGDTSSSSDSITVTIISVDDPPTAVADEVTTAEDTPATIPATQLLSNDLDVDGPTLSVASVMAASHGTVTLVDQTITFTPDANFNGEAGFDYTVTDGEFSSSVHVTVTVSPVDDAPTVVDDLLTTNEDTSLSVPASALLTNDSAVDAPLTLLSVSNASNGVAFVTEGTVFFIPATNFNGTAGFDYTASGGALSASAHVTVLVGAVNDAPLAGADAFSTDEDTALVLNTSDLLSNDTDVDSAIAFVDVSSVSHGAVDVVGDVLTFTPPANYAGTAGFDYSITDGEYSSTAHVTVSVVAVNDAPVAADDTTQDSKNTPLTISAATLLANDTDIDSTSLSVVGVGSPVNGAVTLVGTQITFTPGTDFVGTASFQYTVSDGALSDTAQVTITVVACILGTDSDGDRLDNCFETGTGTYVSSTDTGTNPQVADTDGDGLRDGDEVLGTVDGLDLPGLGANPVHKDIFLEYDWFDDGLDCILHSHRPLASELDHFSAAYAAAPIANPDGVTGIALHHDYGQGGLFTGGNLVADTDGVLANGVGSREYSTIKGANFAANRRGYFHYVLLPHSYNTNSTSSGQAELLGNDMIISMGCDPNYKMAYAVMHELGHNLGLKHGGDTDCNLKPNYNSVMNYLFTFSGIDTDCDGHGDDLLDYSHGTNINLVETALNEAAGVCGSIAINWNKTNGIESSVSANVNLWDSVSYAAESSECGGLLTTLRDYNDWSHITLVPVTSQSGPARPDARTVSTPAVIDCEFPRATR